MKKYATIILLLLIFFVPMGSAWLYFFTQQRTENTVNKGELLTPLVAFSTLGANDIHDTGFTVPADDNEESSWVLFYLMPTICDDECEYNLYKVRQIPRSLGKDEDRVLRLALFTSALQTESFIELIAHKFKLATINPNALNRKILTNHLYVSDPHGNIMLRYPPDIDPKAIFKDLQRLLKVSNIG